MKVLTIAGMAAWVLFTIGCNRTGIIPEQLEGKTDLNLQYADIKPNPEAYKGKLLLAGGKVMSAKQLAEGMELEVLQIPLSRLIPDGSETEARERFVIIDSSRQVSDPAIIENGKRITIVGEVLGTTTVTIEKVQQSVPLLALKHVTVWEWDRTKSEDARHYSSGYPIWGYRGYAQYAYPWW